MRNPFLLIVGDKYYPSSRTGDWKRCFKTYEQAEEYGVIHFARTLLEQIDETFEYPVVKKDD